jgi:hypothetical protein
MKLVNFICLSLLCASSKDFAVANFVIEQVLIPPILTNKKFRVFISGIFICRLSLSKVELLAENLVEIYRTLSSNDLLPDDIKLQENYAFA